jgi:Xaa-Pro aminopeptidase
MKKAHIVDGVALTKFLYWIKNINKKKITEVDAQNKLEKFRRKNKNFLYPSFDTIAGSGKNGAIVHYRANKKNCRTIKNKDIFLCDSGGQYKFGTTDVTRTICFSKPSNNIRNIFTYVLKGHIAVATTNLKKDDVGKKIDFRARKYLKQNNLDYAHGTGHGVGFFLNVHEGPQSISKMNKVKIKEGMILSNEPGYYKKDKFGIRIENLIYVKKIRKKTFFENLTLAPIEKDLINPKLLSLSEKNYLFKYHLNVYSNISKFLDIKEKKWLASFI